MKIPLKLKAAPLQVLVASLIFTLAVFLYPLRTTLTRAALLLGLTVLTATILWILLKSPSPSKNGSPAKKRPWQRPLAWTLVALLAAAALFLCLPARPYDHDALRQSYVHSLRTFLGTRYVYGGETRLGIDCSGLLQAALIEANLKQGLRTLNPALLRNALDIWFHRAPARGLLAGYQGRTFPLPQPVTILEKIDYSTLQPGDFAITADGTHSLAYLGPINSTPTWIESDPFPMQVIELKLHQTPTYWWTAPVQPCRWKALDKP